MWRDGILVEIKYNPAILVFCKQNTNCGQTFASHFSHVFLREAKVLVWRVILMPELSLQLDFSSTRKFVVLYQGAYEAARMH